MEKIIAITLLSGGLDSTLAARLMQEQGLEVIGMYFHHPFLEFGEAREGEVPAARMARELGIELIIADMSREIFGLLNNPPHGFGKNLNPCIDCRIEQLKIARRYMAERGAGFVVTGEVLGQRPMSQRRDAMNIIDRDSGMRGLVLRPLCAQLLKPTIPEEKGWVDREKLLRISGRGRRAQMELAEKFGITDYASPAGGCLLTDEGYVKKVLDLMEHGQGINAEDVALLGHGRHFRLSDRVKLLVGKNDQENKAIITSARPGDIIIRTRTIPGPASLIRGPADDDLIRLACSLAGRYINKAQGPVSFTIERCGQEQQHSIETDPLSRPEVEKYRI